MNIKLKDHKNKVITFKSGSISLPKSMMMQTSLEFYLLTTTGWMTLDKFLNLKAPGLEVKTILFDEVLMNVNEKLHMKH